MQTTEDELAKKLVIHPDLLFFYFLLCVKLYNFSPTETSPSLTLYFEQKISTESQNIYCCYFWYSP